MPSAFNKLSSLLFIVILSAFVFPLIYSSLVKGIGFWETTAGELLVGIGTSILALYTWNLARTEIREGQKSRELQVIEKDLEQIYEEVRYIFRIGVKDKDGSVFVRENPKNKLDVIIEGFSYRIPTEIVSYWVDNIRDMRPSHVEKLDDKTTVVSYKIDSKFQKLIEDQYEKKKKRYIELTSPVE
jgi:virulence-associated protein VapD